jgi:hypothetical protein
MTNNASRWQAAVVAIAVLTTGLALRLLAENPASSGAQSQPGNEPTSYAWVPRRG